MKTWLLVATLFFSNGTEGPTIPIDIFDSFESCDYKARTGWDIVERVHGEWNAYMEDTGDIRPLSHIGLTCVEEAEGA